MKRNMNNSIIKTEHWQDMCTFTDVLDNDDDLSQPMSIESLEEETNQFIDPPNIPGNTLPSELFENSRSIQEIDEKYRHIFQYPNFNFIQSKVFDDTLYSDKSIVVSAPTGTGKTVVFELAIVRLLMNIEKLGYKSDYKVVYMAPVKALCTERVTEWYPKFTRLGLPCIEVTGDTDVDFAYLKPYRIIITTPEKWDMLTRRWTDNKSLVEVIKLFMIDEVHLLNEEGRGPVLEAVVSRMKTIEASVESAQRLKKVQSEDHVEEMNALHLKIRFLAVSATIPNPEDVAEWLGTAAVPAVYYKFEDDCRPVKLNTVVEGYPCTEGSSIFKFDLLLNYKLWPIIEKYSEGRPTMIFCNTRKSVVMTADFLSRELTFQFSDNQRAKLCTLAAKIHDKKLKAFMLSGIGCHHAGYIYQERLSVEQAFRNGDLPILVTTTTLAMGVNLPAHLVIIKSTQQYVNGVFQEYNMSSVLQMMGRAGRPQFDTEATAVIMTRQQDKHLYARTLSRSEPLESRLGARLAEHLNSEVALGSVTELALAAHWARSTFLHVRACRHAHPPRYIEDMCLKAMNGLANAGMITFNDTICVSPTDAGRLMSTFYLNLHTMKLIMKVKGDETLEALLDLVCQSHELTEVRLRMGERGCLNLLNRNKAGATIRFPMKGRITNGEMKVKCLVQAVLGCINIPDPSLGQESIKIMRIGERIIKCLVTYITRSQFIEQKPSYFNTIVNACILLKCFNAKIWENSPFVTRQLKGIGPAFSTLLAAAGKTTFESIRDSNPRDLERVMNKGPPIGNTLKSQVMLLPQYQLTVEKYIGHQVHLTLTLNNFQYLKEYIYDLTAGEQHKVTLLVGDSDNNLLFMKSVRDCNLITEHKGILKITIMLNDSAGDIAAFCISSTFVGLDTNTSLTLSPTGKSLEKPLRPSHKNVLQKNRPEAGKGKEDLFNNKNNSTQTSSTMANYFHVKKRPYRESNSSSVKKPKLSSPSKPNEVYQQTQKDKNGDSMINFKHQDKNLTCTNNTDGKSTNVTRDEVPVINGLHDISDDNFDDLLCNLEDEMLCHNSTSTEVCQLIPTHIKSNNKEGNTDLKKCNSQLKTLADNQQRRKRCIKNNNEQNKFVRTGRPQIIFRQQTTCSGPNKHYLSVVSRKIESDTNNGKINNILLKLMSQSGNFVKPHAHSEVNQYRNIPKNDDSVNLPNISIASEVKNKKMVIDEKLVLNHLRHVSTPILHYNEKHVSDKNKQPTKYENQNQITADKKYLLVPNHITSNSDTPSKACHIQNADDKIVAQNITDSSRHIVNMTEVPLGCKYQVAEIHSPLKPSITSASRDSYTIEKETPKKNLVLDIQMPSLKKTKSRKGKINFNFTINPGTIIDVTKQAFMVLGNLSVHDKDLQAVNKLLHQNNFLINTFCHQRNDNSANILRAQTNKSMKIVKDILDNANNKLLVSHSTSSARANFPDIQMPICNQLLAPHSILNTTTSIKRLDRNPQLTHSFKIDASKSQNCLAPEVKFVSVIINLNEDRTILLKEHPVSPRARKYSQNYSLVRSLNRKFEHIASLTKMLPSTNDTDNVKTLNSMGITNNDLRLDKSNYNSKVLDSQRFSTKMLKKELCSININDCSEITGTYTSCLTCNNIERTTTLSPRSNMYSMRTLAGGGYEQGLQMPHDLGFPSKFAEENSRSCQDGNLSSEKECGFQDITRILDKYKTCIAHNLRTRNNENTFIGKSLHKKYGMTKRPFRIQNIQTTLEPNISFLIPKGSAIHSTEYNLKNYSDFTEKEEEFAYGTSPHHTLNANEHDLADEPVVLSQGVEAAPLNEDLLNPKYVLSYSTEDGSILKNHFTNFDLPDNSHCLGCDITNSETNVASSLKSIFKENCIISSDTNEAFRKCYSVDNSQPRSVTNMSTKFCIDDLREEIEYSTKSSNLIINDSKKSKKHIFFSKMDSKYTNIWSPFNEPRAKKLKHFMLKEKEKLRHDDKNIDFFQ